MRTVPAVCACAPAKVRAKVVVEGANGPTSPEADPILLSNGVLVVNAPIPSNQISAVSTAIGTNNTPSTSASTAANPKPASSAATNGSG